MAPPKFIPVGVVHKLNVVARKRYGKPKKKHGMKCWWMTERSLEIGMESAYPQNHSEQRGHLQERLVRQAQSSVEENRL